MIDQPLLQQLANQLQIDQATVLREYLQIEFLHSLYQQPNCRHLIFKGGTAIRLLFSGTRFSEDLDFTVEREIKSVPNLVQNTISRLASQGIGLELKQEKSLSGLTLKLYYQTSVTPMPLTIRLDFSTRELVQQKQWGTIKTNLPVTTFVAILHLSTEEMLAEKVRAIMNRDKGRDVYDLWYLLSRNVTWNQELINQKAKYYKQKIDIQQLINKLQNWDKKSLDQDLRRFLPRSQRDLLPHLKENAINRIQEIII